MEYVATVRPPDASGLLESQRAHHQRLAEQEGRDVDQDQDNWSDDDDQPPPGAPPGAGRTRTGIRTQPVWLRQEPGGSSSSGQQPPGGGDGDVGASSSSGHHLGAPPPGAGALAVDTIFVV